MRIPGVLPRRPTEAVLDLYSPNWQDETLSATDRTFARLADCPINPEHRLILKLVDEEQVDVRCEGGCPPAALVTALREAYALKQKESGR